MARTAIVIPCFNEARRLPGDAIVAFAASHADVELLLVDDGSTDDTKRVLHKLHEQLPERIEVLELPRNGGKAEAVRQGMARVLEGDAVYCGYFDADLATPLEEIPRFVAELDTHPACEVVFGARVQLLGRHIERNPMRHYLGRVFATVASTMLRLAVYDTQCGAKLFRSGPLARALFAEPFVSSWVFDVEILARLIARQRTEGGPRADACVRELPLLQWIDVAGTKLRPFDFARAVLEMTRIHRRYLRPPRPTA